jgi:putative hydrolase of the HAD superfamily
MLMEPTELLDHVEQTLKQMAGRYDLLLITKGDIFDQESKLARSGLGDLFLGVEIVSEKSVDSYQAIFRRRGIAPGEFVMVGNSLRSDVVPVVTLGGQAVHIPYEVTWHHEHVPDEQLPRQGWKRIGAIGELPAVLEAL